MKIIYYIIIKIFNYKKYMIKVYIIIHMFNLNIWMDSNKMLST